MSQSRVGARTNSKSQTRAARKQKNSIVIDEARGLVFRTEQELYEHFQPQITMLETEVMNNRDTEDIPVKEFTRFESLLQQVIDDPDEVWEDVVSLHGGRVTSYVGHYVTNENDPGVYYVALAYTVSGSPKFVYLHFPSRDLKLVDRFRRGDLVYDRVMKEVEQGAVEGDALSDGDELAVGLYKAMLSLRSATDLKEEKFRDFEERREATIEDPDEIWRSTDLNGNTLVTFVKHFEDEAGPTGLWYLAVTVEDEASSSHALLFSFPTQDENLVDRYRHGENLQAEEVTQEASH